jgi:hypothetical protein
MLAKSAPSPEDCMAADVDVKVEVQLERKPALK